jgi:phage-related protein (TIGR01555 family)
MSRKKKTNQQQQNEQPRVDNGLGDAILPFMQTPYSNQVSSSETLFKNLRYYLVSNFRQILSQAYAEIGLIRTICDVPVDDAFRGGVEIKSKQLSEEQIQDLIARVDRDDELGTISQACKWNRLFGGAGVVIITDQDPETPLNLDAISEKTPLEFRAVDMWELFWDKQSSEGFNIELQEEAYEFYSYYGKRLHKSRVMKLKGITPPSFIRPRLRGWGLSEVEALVRSINQYLKATELGFEVLDEFKLDIFKIKNLTNTLLTPNGSERIQKRVQLANLQKNFQNALTMDSEDDYVQKQLSFSGLSEAMTGFRMQIASDMRMPLTKIFGISSAGFNSGEDDIENYNAMVEGQIRGKTKYIILRMLEIKCQQMFGMVPDDLEVSFKPLRILSAEQEENVKNSKFNRLIQAKQAGLINDLEFKQACNRSHLFDIQIDTTTDQIEAEPPSQSTDEDKAEDGSEEMPKAEKETSRQSQIQPKEAKEEKEPQNV